MVIYPPPPSDGEEEHQVAVLFIDQLSWLSPGRMTWIGYVSAIDSSSAQIPLADRCYSSVIDIGNRLRYEKFSSAKRIRSAKRTD